jgi:periplasmic protein TonB
MRYLVATLLLFFLVSLPPLIPQSASNSSAGRSSHEEIQLSPQVAEKLLIRKVAPVVTCLLAAHPAGTVVIHIAIGTHGEVLQPKLISGPQWFQPSALSAVRQYKYKPYEIDGMPVEVTTSVAIHYDLSNCP